MKKILCITIVSILFITASALAQNIQELRIGSSVSGNLNPGEEIWYSVRPAQAGILIVETSGSIDTYLEVYDENDIFLMEDDDSGEGYNAKVEVIVVPGRVYYFVLSGYGSVTAGPFNISVNFSSFPAPAALPIGSAQSGNLSPGGSNWYNVRTTGRGTLVVETTGNTDTILEVYTDSFVFIEWDDDSGEGLNALIEIPVEANQTYIFRLRGWSDSSGPYRIIAVIE